jgi:glutamine synthetase
VRGKAFPLVQMEKRLRRGVGWTPTNVQITCFDNIAESPFGSLGDLVLIPDPATSVSIESEEGAPNENFVLGNIRYTDGRPWEFCTRSILEAALDRLQRVAGVTLYGAFEHEFQIKHLVSDIARLLRSAVSRRSGISARRSSRRCGKRASRPTPS